MMFIVEYNETQGQYHIDPYSIWRTRPEDPEWEKIGQAATLQQAHAICDEHEARLEKEKTNAILH